MRVMATVSIPVEAGNKSIGDGSLPRVIEDTAKRWNPEAMYFTAVGGERTAYIVFDMPDSSGLPSFAEPFFMQMNARVEMTPVMTAEDLEKGLAQLA